MLGESWDVVPWLPSEHGPSGHSSLAPCLISLGSPPSTHIFSGDPVKQVPWAYPDHNPLAKLLKVLAKNRATLLQHLRKVKKRVGSCDLLSICLLGIGGDHFWHHLHPCGKKEHTHKSNGHCFQIRHAHVPRGHRTKVFRGESYTRSPSWIPGEVGRLQSGHKTWETDHSRHLMAMTEQGDLLQ